MLINCLDLCVCISVFSVSVWGGVGVGGGSLSLSLCPSCFSISPPLGYLTQQVFSCKEELVQFGPLYGNVERNPSGFIKNNEDWRQKF